MDVSICLFVFLVFGSGAYCDLASFDEVNDTVYSRMPPLFHLDVYEPCIRSSGGIYCSAGLEVFSEEPNEIYDQIQKYSSYTKIHYNHSKLYYGICLTESCRDFYNDNTMLDQTHALEACLNYTFHKKYKLRTKLTDSVKCHTSHEPMVIDAVDIGIAAIIGLIIVLNLIGSLYGFCGKQVNGGQGAGFWDCFCAQSNLKRLMFPTKDERHETLQSLYGLRSISTMMVIFSHSVLVLVVAFENTHYFEQAHQNYAYQILFNGTLIVQTFFIISGFLLVYNLLLIKEKTQLRWTMLPGGILSRWLRLTPPYAFMFAVTATWLRHAGSGPLWQLLVGEEVEDCRQQWYLNMMYVHNYVDSGCMPEAWYIAADFQLHILSLTLCLLIPYAGWNITFGLLFIIGLITPAVTTYLLDLEGVLVVSPEAARHLFSEDIVFNAVFKRGHTNIASFAMGLAVGAAVYRWQQTDFNFQHYIKSRFVYWSLPLMLVAICMCGSIFYSSSPYPLLFRAAYAALVKPTFAAIVCLITIGMIFKYENLYRKIMEMQAWSVLARLAYSAYCLHTFVIRGMAGSRTSLTNLSFVQGFEFVTACIVLSFILAVPLWLLVEAPAGQLVKLIFGRRPKDNTNITRNLNAMDNPLTVDVLKSEKDDVICVKL